MVSLVAVKKNTVNGDVCTCLKQCTESKEVHGSQDKNILWHDLNLNPIKFNIFLLNLVAVELTINELRSKHYNIKCLTQRLRHGILVCTRETVEIRNVFHSSDSTLFTPCYHVFCAKLFRNLKRYYDAVVGNKEK